MYIMRLNNCELKASKVELLDKLISTIITNVVIQFIIYGPHVSTIKYEWLFNAH